MCNVYDGSVERRDFPEKLKKIKPAIEMLWWEGDRGLLKDEKKYLAIVGSRRMTDCGRRALETIMPDVVQAGLYIVSGMMYGVDQEAHRLCLKYGGKTIAVLGYGLNYAGIAREDQKMKEQILAGGGLVISEWDKQGGTLWTFPRRNRIVAGLADAVLVVEAAEKSGSLGTVAWAEKFKKEVLAIPGPITSKVSVGTNGLIASGRAKMVRNVEDILCSFELSRRPAQLTIFTGHERPNSIERRILALLENEAFATDEIVRTLGISVEKVNVALIEMSLSGVVNELNGKWELVLR